MTRIGKIVTVGLSPAWDITCSGEKLDWSRHKVVSSVSSQPAGKALNISRALAWMGQRSTAAGLWGRQDYEQMVKAVRPLKELVKVKMTRVDGETRQNITVIDTVNKKEMHLRSNSKLASREALKKLKADLGTIVNKNSVFIFSGSMPEKNLFGDVVAVINSCQQSGAKIVLDTSGAALREIAKAGFIWLIKPNVQEFREMLGEQVRDSFRHLAEAGHKLLDRVGIILISRGEKGAIAVTRKGAWQARHIGSDRKVFSTVACGDYLLAGFLIGWKEKADAGFALETAIRVATAQAWGWTEKKGWPQAKRQIKVECSKRR